MRNILVVANQTLGADALLDHLRTVVADEPSRFHVLVPATAVPHQLLWKEAESLAHAEMLLAEALERFGAEGFDVTGEVGDASPFMAIADAMRHGNYDEILISTLPHGVSQWLRLDLPARVRRRHGVPVFHVVAEDEFRHAPHV